MDAYDLHQVHGGELDFREVLREKARRAVEENRAYVSVTELFTDSLPHRER